MKTSLNKQSHGASATRSISLLVCTVGAMEFAFEIAAVARVEERFDLAEHRFASDSTQPIQRSIQVIDAAHLFLDDREHFWSDGAKDVVLSYRSRTFAMTVDSVNGIYTASVDELVTCYDPPECPAAQYVRALFRIGDRVIYLVNLRGVVRYIDAIDDERISMSNTSIERSDFHG